MPCSPDRLAPAPPFIRPTMPSPYLQSVSPMSLRYTLVLLLAALLPMLVVAYFNLQSAREGVAHTERANLALAAQGLGGRLDQLIEANQKVAQLLGADADIRRFLAASATTRAQLSPPVHYRIGLLMQTHPKLSSLYLMDTQGYIVAAAEPRLIGIRRQFRSYFTEAMAGRNYASNLLTGIDSGEAGVYFSSPVHDPAGRILGVAVVKLKGSAIHSILDTGHDHLQAFLVDADGVILTHPDPAWRYRTLTRLSPEQSAAIQAASQFPVPALEALGAPGLEQSLTLQAAGSLDFRLADDTTWVAGVAPVQQQGWRVILAEPEQRFAAPLQALFHRSLMTLGLSATLVILMAWWLGHTLSRPLRLLASAAAGIKAGHYAEALAHPGLEQLQRQGDELGGLARAFSAMSREIHEREAHLDQLVQDRTEELARKNRLLEATYQRLDQELLMAHDMQQAVLPQRFPGDAHWQVWASMRPAREMGGDFYDCISLRDGRYGLLVADVSGKGVPAAFFMAVSQTILQAEAWAQEAPSAVLARANDLLCARNPMEMFVTVFYAVFDPRTASLCYACAGHSPPLLRTRAGTVRRLETARDPALGVLPGLDFASSMLQLQPGDTLLLYSDGITEAPSPSHEEFGEGRLAAWLSTQGEPASAALCAALSAELEAFVAGAEPFDDQTLMFLSLPAAPVLAHSWEIASRAEEIAPLAEAICAFLKETLGPEHEAQSRLTFRLNLCLDELLTNTITHGLKGDPSHRIQVSLALADNWLELCLQDDAPPFDCFSAAPRPDLRLALEERPIGGLGVQFVRTLVDEYRWEGLNGGNCITLRLQVDAQATTFPTTL